MIFSEVGELYLWAMLHQMKLCTFACSERLRVLGLRATRVWGLGSRIKGSMGEPFLERMASFGHMDRAVSRNRGP